MVKKFQKLTPADLARIYLEPITLGAQVGAARAMGDEPAASLGTRDAESDAPSRDVPLSFASDLPIEHWWGRVILDMKPESVRLERFANHAPVVWNHSWMSSDPENLLGRMFEVSVGHGTARGVARFSRGAKAQKVLDDVRDGLLESISVAAQLHAIVLEGDDDENGPLYRATDWEPLEISFCMVPADISVGVGRAFNQLTKPDFPVITEIRDMEKEKESPAMTPGTEQNETLARIDHFINIGERFAAVELARDFALGGKSEKELFAAISERRIKAAEEATQPKPLLNLEHRDKQRYSLSRAIVADALLRDSKSASCYELDVHEEALKRVSERGLSSLLRGGLIVPTEVLIRAGLDTGTDTKGQEVLFTEAGGFIDMLRNRAKVMMLGATRMPGLQGNVAMPKQIGAGTATWVAENSGSDVAESNLTLDQVTLSPKTLESTTSYSRQLLAQSVVSIDNLVLNDLQQINALAIDRAAIHGLGSSSQPRGIYQTTDVNTKAFAGVITYAKIVDMLSAIAADNADIGGFAFLTTPEVRGVAMQTQRFASTDGKALWENGMMLGYMAEVSNQVSKVMSTLATTGGAQHGLLFGVWPELLIGEWGVLELITDPYRLKKQGMIEVSSFLMCDIALRYPEAFCVSTGQTLS